MKQSHISFLTICMLCIAFVAGIGGYRLGKANQEVVASKISPQVTPDTSHTLPTDKFLCHGYTNGAETYQLDCYFPWDTKTPFQFKSHLECQDITNQHLTPNQTSQNAAGLEVTLAKNDYTKFTLDQQGETLQRSRDAGSAQTTEPYTIIQDSHDIIQAVRPLKDMNTTASYDFLTLSQKTGKGMEVRHNLANWHNLPEPDSITSDFFQCK